MLPFKLLRSLFEIQVILTVYKENSPRYIFITLPVADFFTMIYKS